MKQKPMSLVVSRMDELEGDGQLLPSEMLQNRLAGNGGRNGEISTSRLAGTRAEQPSKQTSISSAAVSSAANTVLGSASGFGL